LIASYERYPRKASCALKRHLRCIIIIGSRSLLPQTLILDILFMSFIMPSPTQLRRDIVTLPSVLL